MKKKSDQNATVSHIKEAWQGAQQDAEAAQGRWEARSQDWAVRAAEDARTAPVDPSIVAEGVALAFAKPDRNAEVVMSFLTRVNREYHILERAGAARRTILPMATEMRAQKQRRLTGR